MGSSLPIIRAINIGLTLIGVAVFGALLYYVQSNAGDFERRTKDFVRERVEIELNERFTPAGADQIMATAAQLSSQLKQKIEREQGAVRQSLSNFVAAVIGAICHGDCGEPEKIKLRVDETLEKIMSRIGMDDAALRRLIEEKYKLTRIKLRRDVTIFLASNLVVSTLALGVSLFRNRAAARLLPVAVALTVSTALASYWYVFGQNWMLTIIFSDFMGWSYLVLLLLFAVILFRIATSENRAPPA